MKKILGLIFFILIILTVLIGIRSGIFSNAFPSEKIENNIIIQDTTLDNGCKNDYWETDEYLEDIKEKDTFNILNAIIFVESSYNDSAYRADEDAVGCLQIRKCMVDDVNRILKRQKSTLRFTYNSRWSRDSSIQMFNIYCDYYNLTTAEEMARCWNGGPRGINNPATVGYWEKVKDQINS
jgi:hypothetical protein